MKRLMEIFRFTALDQNAILMQMLGMYPAVVLATGGKDGFIMGVFVTLVLFFTSLTLSLLRKVLKEEIRLLVIALIVATESTALSLVIQAFFPGFFSAHQIFFEMLCVTGIIFARGESFARYNPPAKSLADALGTGAGYTLVLTLLGLTRELIGAGTLFSGTFLQISLPFGGMMPIFLKPAGGLLLLGLQVALFNLWKRKKIQPAVKKEEEAL